MLYERKLYTCIITNLDIFFLTSEVVNPIDHYHITSYLYLIRNLGLISLNIV